jgi:hypothetical protein
MARINGTLILLKIGANGSPQTLAHVENATWNSSFELADVSNKDSEGYREYLEEAGTRDASIDVNGHATFGSSGNVKELAEMLDDRKNIDFVFGPEGAGNVNFTGKALFNEHSIDTPNEEGATFTGTATVNGKWDIEVTS